jgi:hypothetical protein
MSAKTKPTSTANVEDLRMLRVEEVAARMGWSTRRAPLRQRRGSHDHQDERPPSGHSDRSFPTLAGSAPGNRRSLKNEIGSAARQAPRLARR